MASVELPTTDEEGPHRIAQAPAASRQRACPTAARLRVVYVAGAFRAPTAWKIEQNVRRAEAWALYIWKTGKAAALCPHSMNRFFEGEGSAELWLNGDLALLLRCDAVLAVQGSDDSTGTREDIRIADAAGLPVFHAIAPPGCSPPPCDAKGTPFEAWLKGCFEPGESDAR